MAKKTQKSIFDNFPSGGKYRDNLKLLVTDVKFQERVKEIRAHLLLPENGFNMETTDGEDQFKAWQSDMYRRSDIVIMSDDFNLGMKKVAQQLKDREIGYAEYEKIKYDLHNEIPLNYLSRCSKALTVEFNVPLSYKENIYHYIQFNTISRMMPLASFATMYGTSEDRHERSISLIFYSRVNDNDLRQVKWQVNRFFDKTLAELNPLKDIDTKLAIEEYYRNRDVYDPVNQESYRITAKEIAENIEADTGKKIKADDVYEVVRELNDLRNKRFRSSGKE